MVQSFHRDGFVLGPRLLADADADALASEAARMVSEPDHPNFARIHRGANQPFLHVPDVRFEHPALMDAIRSVEFIEVLRAVVGVDAFQLFECHLFVKPAGEPRIRAWHQDTTYLPFRKPYRSVGAWLSLDGAVGDGGAMVMVSGSHRWGALPAELGDDLSSEALHRAGVVGAPEVRPVPKGVVHLHHPDVWHGSGGNSTDRARSAVSMFFVERGTLFDGRSPYARFFRGADGEPLDAARYPVCA